MANLKKAISSFKDKKILVVGDLMLDLYTYGKVSRISPEAPVPILLKTSEKYGPGGAANVANNLALLGAKVSVCGMIGSDSKGEILMSLLRNQGIDVRSVIKVDNYPTILKHRLVASNHQLVRVDEEEVREFDQVNQEEAIGWVEYFLGKYDGVILSDYVKGIFSKKFTSEIIKIGKKQGVLIVADIKPPNKFKFKGVDLITPNSKEAQEMTGLDDIDACGNNLVKFFSSDVLITRGPEGMAAFQRDGRNFDIPGKKIEVFDVSGAGDTVVAVVTLGLVGGLDLKNSADLANFAGSVVVQKPGTASITTDELEAFLSDKDHVDSVTVVPKVWGYEKWLENNEKYCSKILSVKRDYQCSLHYHKLKDEMFLVTSGHIRLEKGDETIHMMPGSFVRIPPGITHRFRGIQDSEILEISTHHTEADSYRIEESRKVEEETNGEIREPKIHTAYSSKQAS